MLNVRFLAHLREDYLGTTNDLSINVICGIGETMRTYHMEYLVQGKVHTATPATMYSKYLRLT
jgi:hypothetical protein